MKISTVYKLINDIDDLVYIGSTTCGLSKRIGDHIYKVRLGNQSKLYNHMREIGVEHFKILCIKQYTDISKEKLRAKEAKYIKRYDTITNGLNTFCMLGKYCSHNKERYECIICKGSKMCLHGRRKIQCIICSPTTCDRCEKAYAGKSCLKQHQKKCSIDQSNISTE